MASVEEGENLKDTFKTVFGSTARVEERRRDERRAGLTQKQRSRGKAEKRDVQMNFRTTESMKARIEALAARLDVSNTQAIERAIEALERELG